MKRAMVIILTLLIFLSIFWWHFIGETHVPEQELPFTVIRTRMQPQKPVIPEPGNRHVRGDRMRTRGDVGRTSQPSWSIFSGCPFYWTGIE